MAIPRLHRASGGDDDSVGSDSKHRVSHACEPCRQRKTKVRARPPARPAPPADAPQCSGEKCVPRHPR